jgi:hypothetical protein
MRKGEEMEREKIKMIKKTSFVGNILEEEPI